MDLNNSQDSLVSRVSLVVIKCKEARLTAYTSRYYSGNQISEMIELGIKYRGADIIREQELWGILLND